MDVLVLEDCILYKNEQIAGAWTKEWDHARALD